MPTPPQHPYGQGPVPAPQPPYGQAPLTPTTGPHPGVGPYPQTGPYPQPGPYGQPAPPYGAPFPPPYGQHPPVPGWGFRPPTPEEERRRKRKLVLGLGGAALAFAALVIAGTLIDGEKPVDEAETGDCVKQWDLGMTYPDVDVVDCDSDQARYEIRARIEENALSEAWAKQACQRETGGAWDRLLYRNNSTVSSDNLILCMRALDTTPGGAPGEPAVT